MMNDTTEKRLIKMCDATKVHNGIALYMAENAYLNDTALDVLKMVAVWLEDCPIVDAVEVVHGRWVGYHEADIGYDEYGVRCSNCNFEVEDHEVDFIMNYCPNCGAKMR